MDIWRHGDMEIWRYGDMEIWRYGDIEIWRYGDMDIWRYGGYRGQLDVSFLFSPSLLFLLDLGPVQMATARVLPPTTGGGLSPCTGSTERSPSSGSDRQRDLRGPT